VGKLIYAIRREEALSPGKVEEDAAILEAVLSPLEARGLRVIRLKAEDLAPAPPRDALGVLHMVQGPQGLGLLEGWEAAGLSLINPAAAVRACYRRHLFARLAGRIACPETRIFTLAEAREWGNETFPGPGWLKRAEIHAEGPGDVVLVDSLNAALAVLNDFSRRGIDLLAWQEHISGREIKFYGVGPGRFFQAFWAATGEPWAGEPRDPLSELAHRAAALTGLMVFGGDAILTPENTLYLIDLNDWPSFSRCRELAAREIVKHVQELWRL